jgi:rhodanese-related sulfurtransferase
MKKTYLLGVLVFLALGAYLTFSGVKESSYVETKPDKLFLDLIENTRYFTADEVAQMIISQDPSIQLIDVRDERYFNKFSLNGAINIPLKDFLNPDNLAYLDQDIYNTILFSNGSSDADVAWMLATRMGYENIFVMRGGMNNWVDQILQPSENSVIWDRVNDQLYQYRRGASLYFGGSSIDQGNDSETKVKAKKPAVRRKKKEVEGGCG